MYSIFCNEIKNKTKEKNNKESINFHMKYLSRKRNKEKKCDNELNNFSKEGNEKLFEENTKNINELIKPNII